jgi:hypothetical protein
MFQYLIVLPLIPKPTKRQLSGKYTYAYASKSVLPEDLAWNDHNWDKYCFSTHTRYLENSSHTSLTVSEISLFNGVDMSL